MALALVPALDDLHELAEALDGRPLPGVRLSEEEFVEWSPNDARLEWVDGEVYVMGPPSFDHEDLVSWTVTTLRVFAEARDLGWILPSNYTVRLTGRRRLPDVLFISKSRKSLLKAKHFEGAPDLIVEIVSPDSRNRDRREKFAEYERNGVLEYWIEDPLLRTIDMYTRAESTGLFSEVAAIDDRLHSVVLPGFYLRPSWFARPSPPRAIDVLRELGVV